MYNPFYKCNPIIQTIGETMCIYEEFAAFYTEGPYTHYSSRMAKILPSVLQQVGAQPHTILDLACGEGTFAVAAAKRGFRVTGVDASPHMLDFARKLAEKEKVKVEFLLQDMRSLHFEEKFDLVTCWYDSLNYLLELRDLETTFAGVHRALRDGGLFIFDVYTIYGFVVSRREYPYYVEQDTPNLFEVHRPDYDFERNIATMVVTGFIRDQNRNGNRNGNTWVRVDEEHKQRGYFLEEIQTCLEKSRLQKLAFWGSLHEMSDPEPDSKRVWFVTQKM